MAIGSDARAIRIGYSVDGLDEALDNLSFVKTLARASAKRHNRTSAEMTLIRSQHYVPVDTGFLASTGHVEDWDEGRTVGSDVIYDAEYAAAVHERTEVYHKPPTQAKFLERATNEERRGHASRIARNVGADVEAGIRSGSAGAGRARPEGFFRRIPGRNAPKSRPVPFRRSGGFID